MSKINAITPIKDGMSTIEAERAIKFFLKEILRGNLLRAEDVIQEATKTCGVRTYTLITLKDNTQWVLGNNGLERLIGAAYLKNNLTLDGWNVVETKCFLQDGTSEKIICTITEVESEPLKNILTIHSNDFISCSKYMGDKNPSAFVGGKYLSSIDGDKQTITSETGFHDFACNNNIRQQKDGTMTLIDTEYFSFSSDDATPISTETNVELGGAEFIFDLNDILS